jgi:hypothetical protein
MRPIMKAASAAALPLTLAACSASSSTGSAPSASAPTSAAASSASANPDAGMFTGTQLKSMLQPASFFPSGFTRDPSGSVNTGDTYQPATPPGKLPCSRLDSTDWVDLSGIGSVSFAQSDFINKSTSEEYAQEIDEYQGAGAKDVMAALRKLPARCRTFSDQQTSSTVTVKLRKGPSLGDDSLSFTLTSPRWLGGTTLDAVRIGTAVITVLYSSGNGTGATRANALTRLVAGKLRQKTLSAS